MYCQKWDLLEWSFKGSGGWYGNLRFKKDQNNKTPHNIHQSKIAVNVYMTSLPSLVFISPLTLFNRRCKLKDKFPNEIQHQELEYVFTIKKCNSHN